MPIAGTVGALTACGGSSPQSVAEAVGHYDDTATQISAALTADDTSWERAGHPRRAEELGGACQYTPGTWRPADDLPAADDATGWQQRFDAVNPVLEQHGFTPVDELTKDGSREVLESSDDHGATLRVTAEA